MKRWFASFLAVFLAVSTVGQVSLAARMPCSAGAHPAASSTNATDDDVVHAAPHTDAAQSPCHAPGAKDCSDICKRLCGNTAFVPHTTAGPSAVTSPVRLQPSMAAPLLSRATPPDTPPPIA